MLRMDTAQGARAALGEAAQFVRLQRVVVNARTARDQPWRKLMNAISITFPRRGPSCAALLLMALSCKGSETAAPPTTGSIQVMAATTGADLDPDGYTVALQGGDTLSGSSASQPIAVNGTVTFSQLKPGSYSLSLSGATANCRVVGQNPRLGVSVTAGGTAQITFQVTCFQRVDLSGVWNYTEVIGNPLACNDTGTYVFTKSGDGFAGTNYQLGTCDRQDGSIDNSHSSSVDGGGFVYSASGAVSVNFSAGNCFYAADVAGTPPDHLINGSGSCPPGDATWAAVRGGGPISTVTVTPPTRSVVAGGGGPPPPGVGEPRGRRAGGSTRPPAGGGAG